MKKPEEYLVGCEHDGSYIPVNEVKRLLLVAQKDAYNEALGDAAHAVRLSLNGSNTPYAEHCCSGNQNWAVNKSFILELKK